MLVDQDEDAMVALALGELEEEAPEDITENFDFVHNAHFKCVIHRIETVL